MKRYNWIVLTLLFSALLFGYAYCLDMLQALQVHFRQQPYSFTTLNYSLMYFFTYLPIFLFNIPLGTFLDRYPIGRSLIMLMALSLFSQIGLTLLVQTRIPGYLVLIYVMRCLFGVAGEGGFTVQAILVTSYSGQHFQTVMSLALSIPFLFDSINSVVTTRMYEFSGGMLLPWTIGCLVCLFSFVVGLVVLKLYANQKSPVNQNSLDFLQKEKEKGVCFQENQQSIKRKQQSILSQPQNSIERSQITQNLILNQNICKSQQIFKNSQQQNQQFNWRQLKSFSWQFWIITATIYFTQLSLGSFSDNLNQLLVKRFNIPYTDAGTIIIIPFSVLIIFSLIFSFIINKIPHIRRMSFVISTGMYLSGQILIYLIPNTTQPSFEHYFASVYFCITMSLEYSIFFSGIQAAIPHVVDSKTVGTAYGVMGSAIAFSQCTGPIINTLTLDSDSNLAQAYRNYNLCYIFIALVPFCLAFYMGFSRFQSLDLRYAQALTKK